MDATTSMAQAEAWILECNPYLPPWRWEPKDLTLHLMPPKVRISGNLELELDLLLASDCINIFFLIPASLLVFAFVDDSLLETIITVVIAISSFNLHNQEIL